MPMIQFPAAEGTAEAYVARPDDQPHPGVLLFIDAFGLRPQIERMADRIALWGYVVLAPNVFYRSGTAAKVAPKGDLREPGEREAFFATVAPRIAEFTGDTMRADIASYVAALRGLDGVANGPIGVTGYCMGARFATRAAGAHPDDIAAVGGFHGGRIVTDDEDSPHLALSTARAEFVYGHADQDRSMPAEAIEALSKTFADHGLTAKCEVYEGAPHGYSMADTAMYDEESTERHFASLRTLLDSTLRAAS
jgi:carboxymethylenebutenolidase